MLNNNIRVGLNYYGRHSRLGTDRFWTLKATRRRRPFCFFRTLRFPVFREPTTGRFRRSFFSREFRLSVTRVGFPWDEARNKPFNIVSCGGRDRSTETVFQSFLPCRRLFLGADDRARPTSPVCITFSKKRIVVNRTGKKKLKKFGTNCRVRHR